MVSHDLRPKNRRAPRPPASHLLTSSDSHAFLRILLAWARAATPGRIILHLMPLVLSRTPTHALQPWHLLLRALTSYTWFSLKWMRGAAGKLFYAHAACLIRAPRARFITLPAAFWHFPTRLKALALSDKSQTFVFAFWGNEFFTPTPTGIYERLRDSGV